MNKTSSTFCILSHTGMALQNYADYCSCNLNNLSWKNNQHEVLTAHDHPIRDSFKSYTRKMLAASLDNNRRHSSCQVCWDQEDAGKLSTRQQYNKLLEDTVPALDQPKVLIFKPGNTCNMACRMCNPATSSSWYADGYKLANPGVSFKEYTREFEIIRNSYHVSNTTLWDDLKLWMTKLEIIDIYGGEPFLIPGLFDLLEHGVKIGSAKNIKIAINTNASIWNQQYIDILKNYKSVVFKVSADSDVPEQFEYIRHKSKFNAVIENIINFKKELQDLPNFKISCISTITPLNVYYTDLIVKNLKEVLNMPVSVNLVTSPGEYDIRHLPIPVKHWLKNNLKNNNITSIIGQNLPGCDIYWPKFCKITDQLDQIRNQSFIETFPEWWEMLKPHWVGQ